MAPDELDAIGAAFERLGCLGPILDIGSRDVNGTIRPVVSHLYNAYIGIDWEGGPNVDARASGHELPFRTGTFATIVCNSTLEHDPFFFLTVFEMYRVARQGATFIVGTPTYGFPTHKHPVDCYRLAEDAYSNFVLAGCTCTKIDRITRCGPPRLCGSGCVRDDWRACLTEAQRRVPTPYEA